MEVDYDSTRRQSTRLDATQNARIRERLNFKVRERRFATAGVVQEWTAVRRCGRSTH